MLYFHLCSLRRFRIPDIVQPVYGHDSALRPMTAFQLQYYRHAATQVHFRSIVPISSNSPFVHEGMLCPSQQLHKRGFPDRKIWWKNCSQYDMMSLLEVSYRYNSSDRSRVLPDFLRSPQEGRFLNMRSVSFLLPNTMITVVFYLVNTFVQNKYYVFYICIFICLCCAADSSVLYFFQRMVMIWKATL